MAQTTIPANVINDAVKMLTDVQKLLAPYTTPLSEKERKTLPKTSDKTVSFVSKTIEYCTSSPKFLASFTDVSDFKASFDNYMALTPVMNAANQLCSGINDTRLLNGSLSLQAGLQYYNSVKLADKAHVLDAKPIYKDLSVRFPGRKKKKQPATIDTTIAPAHDTALKVA